MALMDFLRTALPSNTAEVTAFNTGANQYMNRRRLSEENQLMQRKEDARLKKMNIGLQPFQSKDPFGPDQEVPIFQVPEKEAPLDLDGGVSQGQDQIPDGTGAGITGQKPPNSQVFQYLEPTDPVEYDDTYTGGLPITDPDKIELPEFKRGNNTARQSEIARRNQINSQLSDIYKQFGIRRKGGQGTKGVTVQQGDAFKFFQSDEFRNFIYQYPEYIDEIKKDPFAFQEKFKTQQSAPSAVTNTRRNSPALADKIVTDRTKDILENDILNSGNAKKVRELATLYGVDPVAALSIFAVESNFGRTAGPSSRGAFGAMQVQPETLAGLKTYFADPANKDAIAKAIGADRAALLIDRMANLTNVQKAPKSLRESEDRIIAGLAYMVYGKAKGIPPNLAGAAYQTSVENVISNGYKPTGADDGYLTNYDYNRAYIELYNTIAKNMPLAGGQTPTTTTQTATGQQAGVNTVTKNSGVTRNITPQGVTDEKPGVNKEDGAAGSSLKGNTPEQITSPITKLFENPEQLGFELQRAIQLRNTMAQFAEIDRSSGLTDTPEYKQQIIDLQIMDTNLYVMQAYDSLYKFSFSGNPAKLNSVLNAFTGGSVLVQPRSDGLFNFIRPDGSPIEGATGLTSQAVQTQAMQIFDSKYKDAVTAAATERAKFKFEKKVEHDLQIQLERAKTNFEMIKKAAEQLGYQITKLGEDSFAVSQGGYTQTYTLEEVEQKIPDSDETEIVKKYIPGEVMQFGFGVGPQDYLSKLVK